MMIIHDGAIRDFNGLPFTRKIVPLVRCQCAIGRGRGRHHDYGRAALSEVRAGVTLIDLRALFMIQSARFHCGYTGGAPVMLVHC